MIEQFGPANGKRAAMTSMKFKRERNKTFHERKKGSYRLVQELQLLAVRA